MRLNTHLSIEGTYSVDVYKRGGELKYSISPQRNFITSSGLSMISKFAVADCFRFISFGTDNSPNTLYGNDGWGTSYLGAILPQYSYIGGRDIQNDVGHARSQYLTAGFTEHDSGVLLSRSWRVPAGNSVFFDQDYTFEEVMLSPGRPYEVGIDAVSDLAPGQSATILNPASLQDTSKTWTSNQWVGHVVRVRSASDVPQDRIVTSNTANTLFIDSLAPLGDFDVSDPPYTYGIFHIFQLCHCNDTVTDDTDTDRNGLDYSSSAIYYSGTAHVDICAASGAFARMVKTIQVAQDDYLIFHYDLNIGVQTGISSFFFDMTSRNTRALSQNANWGPPGAGGHNVSGIHSLIHHGFKLISPGTVVTRTPWGEITQDAAAYWNADFDFGESFMGSWGAPMEPSALGQNLTAYLSNDNLQFCANARNGGAYVAGIPSFSGLSGLMEWRKTPYRTAANNGFDARHSNIRKINAGIDDKFWPIPSSYATETDTPHSFQHDIQSLDPTFAVSIAYPSIPDPSSRLRTVNRSFQFAGPSAGDFANDGAFTHGAQIRALVLGFKDSASVNDSVLPYLDCLFTDSGKVIGPRVIPRKDSPLVGQYNTGTIAGNTASYWYYLDADAKLTFTFQETWSSPCAPTVNGC